MLLGQNLFLDCLVFNTWMKYIVEKDWGAGAVGISRGERCQVSQPEDRRCGGGRGEGRPGQDVHQLWWSGAGTSPGQRLWLLSNIRQYESPLQVVVWLRLSYMTTRACFLFQEPTQKLSSIRTNVLRCELKSSSQKDQISVLSISRPIFYVDITIL